MGDRSESSDEMEVSPKDKDDCESTSQDNSKVSSSSALSVQQDTFENQQPPCYIPSETSLPSTSTSTSQSLNTDQPDEIFSSKDVFYSSRRLRTRTKCSRIVDAVLTNRQHLTACKYHSQESGINIAISSSSQAHDINQLDETCTNDGVFYSSRDLRTRTNCSRRVDALLLPRRYRLGTTDVRLSPRQNLITSLSPNQTDACSVETDRRDQTSLGESRDTEMSAPAELSTVRITRSLSKKLNWKKTSPSPETRSVEKGMGPTSAKRRRTESPENDSGQCGAKSEAFRLKILPSEAARTLDKSPINLQTREATAAAREGLASEPLSRPETPKKRKREMMERSRIDSNDALEFSSASPEATQSTSDMAHSTAEIQMLESSQSRPVSGNPDSSTKIFRSGMEIQKFTTCASSRVLSKSQMPFLSHSPVRISSEDFCIPQRLPEFEAFEKGGTDPNGSDSSAPVSKSNVKSESELKKSSISTSLGMLHRSTSRNLSEIQNPGVPMKKNNDPLLQRQHLHSISSEASGSRERPEAEMDLDTPYLDVHEGQPSTSSYPPVVAEGLSAGDRLSSSGVPASGEERGRVIKSNSTAERISKYISNAQKLLLTVLEEIMTFNKEENMYKSFCTLFLRLSKFPCQNTESDLMLELVFYLEQRDTGLQIQSLFSSGVTPEYDTQRTYETFIHKVVATLLCTTSVKTSLDFPEIKSNYQSLKIIYESFSSVWRHDNGDILNEDYRSHVTVLKGMIQRLFLQTRNAFREILMHVGEHAESRIVDSFEEILWEEDKSFLRRRFL